MMVEAFIAADSEAVPFQALRAFSEHLGQVDGRENDLHAVIVTCRFRNVFIHECARMRITLNDCSGVLELSGCTKLIRLGFPLSIDTRDHYMKAGKHSATLVVLGSNDIFGEYTLWIRIAE